MITDLILLAFLFSILFGIFILASRFAPHSTSPSASKTKTKVGSGGTMDWEHNEFQLKTNLRPVTQQSLLENAEGKGRDGGKFIAEHGDAFAFGKKDT